MLNGFDATLREIESSERDGMRRSIDMTFS